MRTAQGTGNTLLFQALCDHLACGLRCFLAAVTLLVGQHGLFRGAQSRLKLALVGQQFVDLGSGFLAHLAEVGDLGVDLFGLSLDLVADLLEAGVQFADLFFEVAHCDSPWRNLVMSCAARSAAERSGATAPGISVGVSPPPPAAPSMLVLKSLMSSLR